MGKFKHEPEKKLHINAKGFEAWLQSRYPALINLKVIENGEGMRIVWEGTEDLEQENALRQEIAKASEAQ